jgi:zinc transport system substrate-binding protein
MRKIFCILSVLLIGCAVPGLAFAGRLHVAVGVAPVQHFAKMIGGDLIQTTVLVPGGADAHTYEPKPSQMRSIAAASVYLSTGLEFEEAWEARLKGANARMTFVHLDAGMQKLPMPAHHEDHPDKNDHGIELDPHIWVAPSMVRQMVIRIAEAFTQADPAHAKVYAANLKAYQTTIGGVDSQLKSLFSGIPETHRTFLVFHPAWGYLARDYGLTQTAIEYEGKEPSPKRLAGIVSQAKAKGVKVIFVQPQMSRRTASTIAKAIGAHLLVADPLAENWETNLMTVAKGFHDALQ